MYGARPPSQADSISLDKPTVQSNPNFENIEVSTIKSRNRIKIQIIHLKTYDQMILEQVGC